MERKERMRVISDLIAIRGDLQRAELALALDGEETAELRARERDLDAEINQLRRALHEDWQGLADSATEELAAAAGRARERVEAIDDSVARAEAVMDLVGEVDAVIERVRGLVP
ncbi:MAG: hypothetical protein R6V11_00875 [Ectothiorhodospiraceae bacterium]